MTIPAGDRVFVDTNILVYSTISAAPLSSTALKRLTELQVAGSEFWISRQVLREYLAVLSRPQTFAAPIPINQLVSDVTRFETDFNVVEDGPKVTVLLKSLLTTIPCSGKQIHDANIVATMLAHNIPTLLTHNVADFQRFAGQIALIPLIP